MSARLLVAGQDVSADTFYDVSVTCGREDVSSQPDGSVLNATLRDWHGAGAVGDAVALLSTFGERLLFHGTVTDLVAKYAVERDEWETKLTATGPLAALGHALAGRADYPAETDPKRIARVLDETGFPHDVNPSLAGPTLIARLAGEESAADIARGAADSGLGVLWEDPSDELAPIRYTPQRYRTWGAFALGWSEVPGAWRDMGALTWSALTSDNIGPMGRPPIVDVNPRTAFAEVSFVQTVSDYARAHTVTYGEPPAEIVERAGMPESSGTPTVYTESVVYELGHGYVFHEQRAAEITGLRFYRPAGYPAGTVSHTLTLWDSTGTALGSAVTEDEQDNAWAVAMLASPVRIVPGELYWVSYLATDSYMSLDAAAPLSADATLCECMGAAYADPPGGFPATPIPDANYFADLLWHLLDERPTVTVGDKNPHGDHDTELANENDAEHYAELKLRQTKVPRWRLDRFEVRLSRMFPSDAGDLIAALQVGTRIELHLPPSSPVGERWQGFLEGWSHSLIPYEDRSADHRLSLQVSDRSLTEPGASWRNIGGHAWADVHPSLSWRETVSFE